MKNTKKLKEKNNINFNKYLGILTLVLTISEIFNIVYIITTDLNIITYSFFRKIFMIFFEIILVIITIITSISGVKFILADFQLNKCEKEIQNTINMIKNLKNKVITKKEFNFYIKKIFLKNFKYVIPIAMFIFQIISCVSIVIFSQNKLIITIPISISSIISVISIFYFGANELTTMLKLDNSIENKIMKAFKDIDNFKTLILYNILIIHIFINSISIMGVKSIKETFYKAEQEFKIEQNLKDFKNNTEIERYRKIDIILDEMVEKIKNK